MVLGTSIIRKSGKLVSMQFAALPKFFGTEGSGTRSFSSMNSIESSSYLSRLFPKSNSSFLLCRGNALQSSVLRLGSSEDMYLLDAGLGTPKMCMQDELTGSPTKRAARFENKVGFLNAASGETVIRKRMLERFFTDLVFGDNVVKKRAAARFNSSVGSMDLVGGEPLLLPRRFRQNRAWVEMRKIWRNNQTVKGVVVNKVRGGYAVAVGGFITFRPLYPLMTQKIADGRFRIQKMNSKTKNVVVI